MEIQLIDDRTIRLTADSPGFGFASENGASLSPFHLLAASLATCTWSVLQGYGDQAEIPLDGLAIGVAWELGGEPYHVTNMSLTLHWPELPENRREAARRVAARCTIHQTLHEGSHVETRVATDD